MTRTFGAPFGAFVLRKAGQSGFDLRTSSWILPLNFLGTAALHPVQQQIGNQMSKVAAMGRWSYSSGVRNGGARIFSPLLNQSGYYVVIGGWVAVATTCW